MFFDQNNKRGRPVYYIYPSLIDFDNFKKNYEDGKLKFVQIDSSFNRTTYDITINNGSSDETLEISNLCEVANGKLINQDIDFNEYSIFKDYDRVSKTIDSNNRANMYTRMNSNYRTDLKFRFQLGNSTEEDGSFLIKERNIK